jgi:hypothetical protein
VVCGGADPAGGTNNAATGVNAFVGAGQKNTASDGQSFIGGGSFNTSSGAGSVVCGGNNLLLITAANNTAGPAANAVVVGGDRNAATGIASFVGCGILNTASGINSFIGNGTFNTASNTRACICNGFANTASGVSSFIGAGTSNVASGAGSIALGSSNVASGLESIALGSSNTASGINSIVCGGPPGGFFVNNDAGLSRVFVWGDTSGMPVSGYGGVAPNIAAADSVWFGCGGSTVVNTPVFTIFSTALRTTPAPGVQLVQGSSVWAAISDANAKENFVLLDTARVLRSVDELPIYEYNFKGNPPDVKCRGPIAQDWHRIFPSNKPKHCIDTMDLDGVALAAIKGLSELVKKQGELIKDLTERLAAMEFAMFKI